MAGSASVVLNVKVAPLASHADTLRVVVANAAAENINVPVRPIARNNLVMNFPSSVVVAIRKPPTDDV